MAFGEDPRLRYFLGDIRDRDRLKMALHGVEGGDKAFYTTGRLTSEMVIKAAQMQMPFLVSRSGLTQMGHDIAVKTGITMIGRCQGRHYLLFTGQQRFVTHPATLLA